MATILKALGAFGGLAVIVTGISAFVSKYLSSKWLQKNKVILDQQLETHKAALAQEAEVQKSALSQQLETHRAALTKETETHKLALKRQELLFQREIEAVDAFMSLWRKIWPQHARPDMDWHEACEDVALRLGSVESLLDDYLEHHSAATAAEARRLIESAQAIAASEKFYADAQGAPSTEIQSAERMLHMLREAREKLLDQLRA